MAELGLGECRAAQARGAHARQFEEQPVKFVRAPLSPAVQEVLTRLKVLVACWPERPNSATASAAAATAVPLLPGAGKKAEDKRRGGNRPAPVLKQAASPRQPAPCESRSPKRRCSSQRSVSKGLSEEV